MQRGERRGRNSSSASSSPPDLRTGTFPDVLAEVERGLGVRMDYSSMVLKRRSLGSATDRGTWVRIEARPLGKLHGQSADGVEAAALVSGVDKPAWYRGLSWIDTERGLMWRADETEKVAGTPISGGGVLIRDPGLSDYWWRALARSLAALADAPVNRVATVHTVPITQNRITATIESVFGGERYHHQCVGRGPRGSGLDEPDRP